MKRVISNRMYNKWLLMTENNNHTECVMDIAKYFGYKDLYNAFKAIYNIHNAVGNLPYEISRARFHLTEYLLDKIMNDYGDKVWEEVNNCL